MNEDNLIKLLNNLDDDLVDKEIDKLMNGIEIDQAAITRKAFQRINRSRKMAKRRKRLPFAIAACLCIFSITAVVYASDISEAFKGLFNKKVIYSTIVEGKGYYLKEGYQLDENIKLKSVIVSQGNLEIELATDGSLKPKDLKVVPKNDPNTVYVPGGYAENEGEYYFCTFSSLNEENYDIKPFKEFQLVIDGKSYEVSLDEGQGLDFNNTIYTSQGARDINGVDIFATKISDENNKVKIQLIAQLDDQNLELIKFGRPLATKLTFSTKNLGEKGIISSSTSTKTEELYLSAKNNNRYKLEIPQDSKGRPVTIFETNAPQGEEFLLEIPAIIASYREQIQSFTLSLPREGEVELNKEIDFKQQKAVLKKIKRLSPTSAQLEVELNTAEDNNINIMNFDLFSQDMKEIQAEFNGDKGIITCYFEENLADTEVVISYPYFVMNGDWVINIK